MKKIKKALSALTIIFFILILIFCYFFMDKNPNVVFAGNILVGINITEFYNGNDNGVSNYEN